MYKWKPAFGFRIALYERQLIDGKFLCFYCRQPMLFNNVSGRAANNSTVDHILPRSKGGKHTADNLIVCCATCNSTRQDMPIREWLAIWSKVFGRSLGELEKELNAILRQKIDHDKRIRLNRIAKKHGKNYARSIFQPVHEFLTNSTMVL